MFRHCEGPVRSKRPKQSRGSLAHSHQPPAHLNLLQADRYVEELPDHGQARPQMFRRRSGPERGSAGDGQHQHPLIGQMRPTRNVGHDPFRRFSDRAEPPAAWTQTRAGAGVPASSGPRASARYERAARAGHPPPLGGRANGLANRACFAYAPDRCIECGLCEPVCPARFSTVSPRQRTVLSWEIAAVRRAREELPEGLARDYGRDARESCVRDSMCIASCPVKIDSGGLMAEVDRAESSLPGRVVAGVAAGQFSLTALVPNLSPASDPESPLPLLRAQSRRLRPPRGPPTTSCASPPG